MTPGRKPSTTTSAFFASRRNTSHPFGFFSSSRMPRLLRLAKRKNTEVPSCRAPISARCSVAIGPGSRRVRSRTRMPDSGFARKLFDRLAIGAPRDSEGFHRSSLFILLRVLDHPAVVRQVAGLSERDFAPQLGDAADAFFYRVRKSRRRSIAYFALQGHAVGSAGIVHDQPRFQDFLVSPCDFGHLRRLHEHALHLGGLVGTAHPAADARVGAAAGADPRQHRGQVPGAEADQRIIRIEAGDDDLTDFAFRYGLARARTHDLEDQRFI